MVDQMGGSCLEGFFDCRGWATVRRGVCMCVGSACVRVCVRVWACVFVDGSVLMGLCRFEGLGCTSSHIVWWVDVIACVYEDLLLSFPHCDCACGVRGGLRTRGTGGGGR